MTNRSVAALLAATVATVIVTIAAAATWPTRPLLLSGGLAITTWILFAVLTTADRVVDQIEQAARRMEQAGDDRHAEGVIEGMRRVPPTTPGLRGVQ